MFLNSKTTIFARMEDRLKAEAYINEYQNQASLKNAPATEDYKRYMTKSLINRGFLFKNYEAVEALYKSALTELFSNEFKNIFLYDKERDISGVYSDISNVKNMGPIGIYDYFSSIITVIGAKYLPTFDSFDLDLNEIEYDYTVSDEEKREIIDSRTDKEELPVLYRALRVNEIVSGPDENIQYYIHPKTETSYQYVPITDEEFRLGPQDGIDYYILEESQEGESNYVKVLDFDIGNNYIKLTDDEISSGIVEGKEYYTYNSETDTFELCENLESFDSLKTYYKLEEGFVFKDNVTYYVYKEVEGTEVEDEYALVENLTEFDSNVNYFVKELDYDSIELTEDEINPIKQKFITSQIDNIISFYMKDVIVTIKEIFSKYSIYKIMNSVSVTDDSYVKSVIQLVYSKFLHVFASLAYSINISENLTENSQIKNVINKTMEYGISKVKTISDMMSSEYVNNFIFENLIPVELQEKLFKHYKLYSPVADQIEYNQVNIPVTQTTCVMTENLINTRSILENIDINEISFETLFTLIIYTYINFVNILYYNAYISKTKVPVIKSVQELIERFEPSYDKVISGDELKKFIKLGDS